MTTQQKRATVTIVETATADVAVYGADMMGKKALLNMATILNALGEHGVRSVTFSEEAPKGMVANCAMDSGAITLNIMETFVKAFEMCLDKEKQGAMAISFLFWHNIYVSIIHESLHLNEPTLTEEGTEDIAIETLFSIAKEFDLEPGVSPFITFQMGEFLTNSDDKFIAIQKSMWEAGESFTNGKTRLTSYHDFAHLFSGKDDKDPEWNQQVKHKLAPIISPAATTEVVNTAIPAPLQAFFTEPSSQKTELTEQMFVDLFKHNEMMAGYTGEVPIDDDDEVSPNFFDDAEETPAEFEARYREISGFPPAPYVPPAAPVAPITTTPQHVVATPEQLAQIKAFVLAGNVYFPQEHGMIGTPQQMLELTGELLSNHTPTTTPKATVSHIQEGPERIAALPLPKTGLTPERTGEIMMGLYTKCFNHIFGTCEQLSGCDTAFGSPQKVLIPITLTPEEQNIVVGFNCHINEKWCKSPVVNGTIWGFVGGIKRLPTYKLFINLNGTEMCRLVLPQNPAKRHGEFLSPKAVLARKGVAIMYIMEGNDAAKEAGAPQWLYKAIVERSDLEVPAVATTASWQVC